MIAGVIFDLDDTLIDDTKGWEVSLRQLADHMIDVYHWNVSAKLIAETYKEVSDFIWKNYDRYLKHLESNIEKRSYVWSETIRKLSVPYSIELAQEIAVIFTQYREQNAFLFRGVEALLEKIHQKQCKMIICTDGEACVQKMKLRKTGIEGYFEALICGVDLGKRKPDQKIFRSCLAFFQEEPDRLLYLGDQYYLDIVGASSVGMRTIWIDNRNPVTGMTTTISQLNAEFDRWFI